MRFTPHWSTDVNFGLCSCGYGLYLREAVSEFCVLGHRLMEEEELIGDDCLLFVLMR